MIITLKWNLLLLGGKFALFLSALFCLNTPLIYGAASCEFEPDASAGLQLTAFNKP